MLHKEIIQEAEYETVCRILAICEELEDHYWFEYNRKLEYPADYEMAKYCEGMSDGMSKLIDVIKSEFKLNPGDK